MNIMIGSIVLVVVVLVIVCVYDDIKEIYKKATLRYEEIPDVAEVVEKNYQYNKTVLFGNDEEYNIFFEYKGRIYCFNDFHLYEKVEVGDNINIFIKKGFKNKELKEEYISVEE